MVATPFVSEAIEKEALEVEEQDPSFAAALRAANYDGFEAKGVRPYGCPGVCLVGNIVFEPNRRSKVRLITVTVGDLVHLIAAAAGEITVNASGNHSFVGKFRGRDVEVIFYDNVRFQVYKNMVRGDTVSLKVFHNPLGADKGEHHVFWIGPGMTASKGPVVLDKQDHPTADLITSPIILSGGTRVPIV